MPRLPSRLFVPALSLIALSFLSAVPATARPREPAAFSAAERAGFISQLGDLLSLLWGKDGSVLNPDGTPPATTSSGDNGSGLEPNG